jgi:FHA domain
MEEDSPQRGGRLQMTELRGQDKLALVVLAVAGPVSWLLLNRIARLQVLNVVPAKDDPAKGVPAKGVRPRSVRGSAGSDGMNGSRLTWSGQRWALLPASAPYRIGYADDNSVKVPQHDMSPHQAVIDFDGSNWILVPLQTKKPTILNGKALSHPTLLTHGSSIMVGSGPAILFHSSRGFAYPVVELKARQTPHGAGWSLNAF